MKSLRPTGRARRALAQALGPKSASRRFWIAAALGLWALAFAVRVLHAADVAPVMYTHDQPGTRMAARYADAARAHVAGEGLLYPRVWPDPSETGLLSRPPGYPLFMAAVYRTLGDSHFDVQLVQCALGALLPVILWPFATRLVGRNVGLMAGVLAAVDAPLGFYPAVVTPDSLGTLLAVVVLALAWRRPGWRARWTLVLAGLLLGAATWLRPNFLFLAPFLAVGWLVAAPRRRAALPWALGLAAAAALVVAPITVRNFRLYHAFVPVSINGGIVLWEGIADAGGERFGARGIDWQVAAEEAQRYGDARYAAWWASPDGIWRDHERVRRSLEVIRAEPVWFTLAAVGRAGEILSYGDGGARRVAFTAPAALDERGTSLTARALSSAGRGFALLRPAVAPAQWLVSVVRLPLAVCGVLALALACPRRLLLLGLVPLYHLLTQAPLHYEPRFVLPMHPFVLVLAAAGAMGLLGAVRAARRRA